jgi:hypothetical protein
MTISKVLKKTTGIEFCTTLDCLSLPFILNDIYSKKNYVCKSLSVVILGIVFQFLAHLTQRVM